MYAKVYFVIDVLVFRLHPLVIPSSIAESASIYVLLLFGGVILD